MHKIPRWLFSSAVLIGLGWAGIQSGLFDDQLDTLAAVGGINAGLDGPAAREARLSSTPGVYRLATVERRRIVEAVQATGSVMPVALVSVSSQISGQIKEIYADFNHEVHAGDPIALIDPLTYRIAVEQSEAQVGIARSNVQKAEVALDDAEADWTRKRALAERGTGAKADATKAQAVRGLAAAERDNARYALQGAEAALKQARADLDRTVIRSPVDGTVIVRNIEIGTTVAVSLQAPVLFTIAQDLRKMQVNTSVPEAEIGRIRVGQRMEFTVDSFPGRIFVGEVIQIRKQPQSTQNVVTYTVVASAPNPELLLLPGMTATARIIVDDNDGKLSVPTAALRFRPPGEPRSLESRVFVERQGRQAEVRVSVGSTDGAYTAVTAEGLAEGDRVITGLAGGAATDTPSESRGLLGIF